MSAIRVVLVDDHRIVRQGLRSILDPDPRFEVVGEAANGAEALCVVAEQQPDIVLLDLQLPSMGGVELCHRIVEASPEIAVLILTAFIDRNLVNVVLKAGARGYLLKDAENLRLQERLLSVVEGHTALDPRAADVLADYVRQRPLQALNLREMEILRLIAQGLTNREIGERLFISVKTVNTHVGNLFRKAELTNRAEATAYAIRNGITNES